MQMPLAVQVAQLALEHGLQTGVGLSLQLPKGHGLQLSLQSKSGPHVPSEYLILPDEQVKQVVPLHV